MRKLIITLLILSGLLAQTDETLAHGGGAAVLDDNHTVEEEAAGRAVWEKLRSGAINCVDVADEDFGALGEYFMGRMLGGAHQAMNDRLTQALGEAGEEQMHRIMGKRMSDCDPQAVFPAGMIPMMTGLFALGPQAAGRMMDGSMTGGGSAASGFGFGPGHLFGLGLGMGLFGVFVWTLAIVGLITVGRWLAARLKKSKTKS